MSFKDEREEKAATLVLGLQALGDDFVAEICEVCKGQGEYEQTYTAGCGGGSYKSMGPCDWCNRRGVRYKNSRSVRDDVGQSIVNQILVAAQKKRDEPKPIPEKRPESLATAITGGRVEVDWKNLPQNVLPLFDSLD